MEVVGLESSSSSIGVGLWGVDMMLAFSLAVCGELLIENERNYQVVRDMPIILK